MNWRKIQMKYDPIEIEEKWQKKWEDARIFEANPDKKSDKKFITSPYPYASGPSHIGQGRAYVNGDIFARYYRAKGYNVLYPMAFHITGTPVLAISSAIERGEKKIVSRMKEYVQLHTNDKEEISKIVNSFKDPWNVVNYFSKVIKLDMKAIGMSLDWRREFTTGDKIYNKLIEWQFLKFKKQGLIEKGEYPILYCPRDENAVGEDDIASGDELDLGINEFINIKFPFEDGYIVASTLRPETIFGVTNIWVNPNSTYVIAKVDGEKWVISEDAVKLLLNQNKIASILEKFKGRQLVGRIAKALNGGREIPIFPGDFVDASMATGVVYSVPAHAPYDYIALKDLQKDDALLKKYKLNKKEVNEIKPIKIIDLKRYEDFPAKIYCEMYNVNTQLDSEKLDKATSENYKDEFYNGILNEKCSKFDGIRVEEAVTQVIKDLVETDKADKLYIPITKNLRCRCGEKIIIRILKDQWFMNFNASNWKQKAFECLKQMEIKPKKYRQTFVHYFNWLEKRPCARKRGLGTHLPFDKEWIIESLSDSTIYMSFYTIVHIIRSNNINPEQLLPEVFDYIFLKSGDLISVSKKSKINEKLLIELQEEFFYWYPVDHRHTAIMHISNHLSFYIFHHVAIFPKNLWPKIITLIEPVIIEGQKMGKSKGNVISLADIKKKYSGDLFRFYIAHGADLGIYMDFRDKQIQTVRDHISRFYSFMYENILKSKDYNGGLNTLKANTSRTILSKIMRFFIESDIAMGEFNQRRYLQISFYEIFNLIQDFKKFSESLEEFYTVFRMIYSNWLKILSLAIPHLTEELWEIAGNNTFISQEEWEEWDKTLIDEELELEFDYISSVIGDIQNILKVVKTKEFDSIFLYTAPPWKNEINQILFSNEGDFKKTIDELKKTNEKLGNKQVVPFIKTQIKTRGWNTKAPKKEEKFILNEYVKYVEKRVGKTIIIDSDFDPKGKSDKAIPFKPAIFIDI